MKRSSGSTCRDERGDGSSDDGPGGSTIVSELSLGEGIGRARPSRTQSAGSRLKSAPATPFSALLHAAARTGPAPGLEERMPRVGSFPGAGKRILDPADLEHGPQQKRARTMLLPEMIHDSQQMSYRPTETGTLNRRPACSYALAFVSWMGILNAMSRHNALVVVFGHAAPQTQVACLA